MVGLLESYAFYLEDNSGFAQVIVVIINGVVDGVSIHLENISLNVYHRDADSEVFNAVLDIAERLTRKAKKVTYRAVRIEG